MEPKCKGCNKPLLLPADCKFAEEEFKYDIPKPPKMNPNTGLPKATIKECVVCYGQLDRDVQELICHALAARLYAYAPYSKFRVGAAFRTRDDHKIFSGCNVENAAFSPVCCAERTAIVKAVSEGYTRFRAGVVVAFQQDSFTTPCGVCRQFIMEFASEDIPIYVTKANDNGEPKQFDDPVLSTSIYNLLPNGFRTFIQTEQNKC